MVYITHGFLRLVVCVTLILGCFFQAQASAIPDLPKGSAWLGTKLQADGSFTGDSSSVATPPQTRGEVVSTLKQLLITPPSTLMDAISADAPTNTELLARQAIALKVGGQDSTRYIGVLIERQNLDGGFGGEVGFNSNVLDTAWALLAIAYGGQETGTAANLARSYLEAGLQSDGGMSGITEADRIQGTALAFLALQSMSQTDLNIATIVHNLAAWLQQRQGIDGGWLGDLYLSAMVSSTLAPTVSDTTFKSSGAGFIASQQGADGSWLGDAFLSAIALRSLSLLAVSSPATSSRLSGKVFDSISSVPIGGADVSVVSQNTQTKKSDIDGNFAFDNLSDGVYQLQISTPGYELFNSKYTLGVSQSIDAGFIKLKPLVNSGIVRGRIVDAISNNPLSGVNISVNSGVGNSVNTKTDTSGNFSIPNVLAGSVQLTVNFAGYTSVTTNSTVTAGQVLLFSPTLYTVGAIKNTTGVRYTGQIVVLGLSTPLNGVHVQVSNSLGTFSATTNSMGQFDVAIPSIGGGSYIATFSLSGYGSVSQNFVGIDGMTVSAGIIGLTPNNINKTFSVKGKVLSSSNTGIGGAVVQLVGSVKNAITASDGSYSIESISQSTFSLRVSASGYNAQSINMQQPIQGDAQQDFMLIPQNGSGGFSIANMMVTPISASRATDISTMLTIENSSSVNDMVIIQLQVINSKQKIVGKGIAYDASGNMAGQLLIPSKQQQSMRLVWNTGQYPAGGYTLRVRLIKVGSITTETPLGEIFVERATNITITEEAHFTGAITTNPPVIQAGMSIPVKISAVLSGDGNKVVDSQLFNLTIVNEKDGNILATQQVLSPAFGVNSLQTLTFKDWIPPQSGSYRLELTAADLNLGKVVGSVYIGDVAKARYVTNELVVPTGTQNLRATLTVAGQDVAGGVISDPLAPLIKKAIQSATHFNYVTAAANTLESRCNLCHIQAQALVSGELTRNFTNYDVDATNRAIILNELTTFQQLDGGIDGTTPVNWYKNDQSALGLWALSAWHNTVEIASTITKLAKFIANSQKIDGTWPVNDPRGWWTLPVPHVSLNTKGLVDAAQAIRSVPSDSIFKYERNIISSGFGGIYHLASDAAGNIYTSNPNDGTVQMIKPDGSRQSYVTGLYQPNGIVVLNNGIVYIASGGGLFKRNVDGSLVQISSLAGAGLALGPDGNLYMGSSFYSKIYKITINDEVISDYIVGGELGVYGIQAISFAPNGDLFVGNIYPRRNIVRYRPDLSSDVVVSLVNGDSKNFLIVDNGIYVTTDSGLYFYNSDWHAERLLYNGIGGIIKKSDGKIVVSGISYGDDSISYLIKTKIDTTPILADIDTAISRATSWLLHDSNTDSTNNLIMAQRLIGLNSAKVYYKGQPLENTLQEKMASIASQLRANVLIDGGWGYSTGYIESDSMVTAQVGFALDSLNPSPSDSIVQNAIKLLLSRQRADGTWYSENNIMVTPLAATTWVAIWLPIALDRLGGIDTDLNVTFPSNVKMTNPDIAPASTVMNGDGSTTASWKMIGVTSAGRSVSYDLTLLDMTLDEVRAVSTDAHLTFTNSFTGETINAPISIPRVAASGFMNLGVTTDNTVYPSDALVDIYAQVKNTGSGLSSGSVKFEIFSPDKTLISSIGSAQFVDVATNAVVNLAMNWNTAKTLTADGYYVTASLFDSNNRFVGSASAKFAIQSNTIQSNNAQITSDSSSYNTAQTVQLTARVGNITNNVIQTNLVARTVVLSPTGQVIFTQSEVIPQLVPGGTRQYSYSVPVSGLTAGNYKTQLELLNAQGTSVAQSTGTFTVASGSQNGIGVLGTLQATPTSVLNGQNVNLSLNTINNSNTALVNVPLTVRIIDPVNNVVLASFSNSANVLPRWEMGASQSLQWVWNATGQSDQVVMAVASAMVGGKEVSLGQASIRLMKPVVVTPVLNGTLVASPAKVGVGGTLIISSTLSNPGDIDISDVPFMVSVVDSTQKVVASWPYSATILRGKSYTVASSWKVTGTPGVYTLVLTATLGGKSITLGSSNVEVTLPPVKLNVVQAALRQSRLLVLLSCRNGEDTYSEQHSATLREDEDDEDDGKCATSRLAFVKSLLVNAAPNQHHITTNADEFTLALRSGQYNTYWISGGAEKLSNGLAQEVREAVNRGDSLLMDGIHDERNKLLDEVVGIEYKGKLQGVNLPMTVMTAPLNGVQLQTIGRSLKLNLGNGALIAKFPTGMVCKDCDDDNERKGTSKTDNTAIAAYLYGRGKGIVMGFDLIGSMQNYATNPHWVSVVRTTFDFLIPELPSSYTSGAYAAVRTTVNNLGLATDISVNQTLPANVTAIVSEPVANVNGQKSQWNFNLPADKSQDLTTYLRLPNSNGSYVIDTAVSSIVNGQSSLYNNYSLNLQVATAGDTVTTSKLISDLKALSFSSSQSRQKRDQAVKALQDALVQKTSDKAISKVLDAVEKIRSITDKDMSSYRLQMGAWLQELALQWKQTQLPTTTKH